MTTRIKLRRDTAANWTENDPVLALGEAGYDTTNNELRVGDGTTVWSGLEAIGGTGNKITAEKTYSRNESDGSEQTFTYTTGSIAVQMENNDGLYLNDLLSRWVSYFDGNTTFPYNYSNINLVINPGTTNLSSTVTNVISDGNNPTLYTITLGTTDPGPIVVDDIDFNYTYINTIGLDIEGGDEEGGYFGIATGDDDITIRSGQDINLVAADDFYVYAGDNLELLLVNLDDNSPSEGIDIITRTTSTDYTWTFRFDGHLELPEGLSLPTQTNTGYEYDYTLAGPTLRLSNDSQNQVIVTGPATTEANPYAQRIVIQGQRGFGVWETETNTVGEGGDVYIWGGTGGESENWTGGRTGGSGGDVKLRGGQGQDHDGGYVRIEGGNTEIYNNTSTGYGGFVEITGGDVVGQAGDPSDPSKGGNVIITGGRAYSASTQSGVVGIVTGGSTNPDVAGENYWEFGNSGTLTLPEGSILSGTRENVTVTLDQFNDGGFTGTQVFSKVSDILYQVLPSGPTMELVSGVWYLKVDVATYYNSTDLMTWAESAGGLPTPVGTIGTLATTNLTLDANTWTFSGNGGLTFPDSTVQTTAYVDNRTTGSWTLATGANTVSITVALNNNYQMWVNGNIPNGIVEWNATVNVSNPNVPAIGSQHAWYYYAGNALELTAIPDQIVGTTGVISTSSSYAGTASNVFTFGITNNSTSTQVVTWGYTTL